MDSKSITERTFWSSNSSKAARWQIAFGVARFLSSESLKLALQIAEALEAAHEKGVIHRDLKPANIKVTPEGRVKVLDFGLSKALEPAADAPTLTAIVTLAGAVIGTPAYMSPEQARGDVAGRQADIWSFGVVLYELLTGVSPFARRSTAETLASVLGPPPDYAALPSHTPAGARHLVRRCLEKDPKRRLQHMGDVRLEIEEALAVSRGEAATGPADTAVPIRRRWRAATSMAGGTRFGDRRAATSCSTWISRAP